MADGVRPRRSAACAKPPTSCVVTRVRRVSRSRLRRSICVEFTRGTAGQRSKARNLFAYFVEHENLHHARWRRVVLNTVPSLPCRLSLLSPCAPYRLLSPSDPSRTQLRNPADELHRNRLRDWKMDRPLSQLIALEFTCQFREERP